MADDGLSERDKALEKSSGAGRHYLTAPWWWIILVGVVIVLGFLIPFLFVRGF